jgi:hypothetical protein
MSDEVREVVVLETADPTELRLARNLFEQEGIPCRVDGGGASAYLGSVLGAPFVGVQSLVVPLECEARALEVLRAAWPESPADER